MARLGRRALGTHKSSCVAGTTSGISGSLEAEVEMGRVMSGSGQLGPSAGVYAPPPPAGPSRLVEPVGSALTPAASLRWGAAPNDPGPRPALLTEGPQTSPHST